VPAVTQASGSDPEQIVALITLAFVRDPPSRWLYPEARHYLERFPDFVRALGGKAFAHGTADIVEGDRGAALWLPPGVQPDDDALDRVLKDAVGERLEETAKLFETMARYHPSEPHWFLPLMGVDPFRQGAGIGSALLQHAVDRCDRDRKPAYLESTNPRNISFYRRFGFEVLGTIEAAGCPPISPMLRRPR
jgi:ribosomal protein S18 acetylase RimI-like enzyme